uniref:Putative sulfotransferase n=1 Tax=Amblyomma aureolatum TaxID=187763 RepID=A0A1E1XI18_9ACAR
MDEESYRDVDGVWMHKIFREEQLRSAMNYKPREGDIVTVTYPKCGTNWMQVIIWNIITRAKPTSDIAEFSLMCPFIEITGAAAAEHPARVGPVMTHLPMSVFRPVEHARYIYVARNPYDCAVSYYHFIKGLTPKTVTDVSFARFLSLFLTGKVIYGDYFDHLLPWYERRQDANVLFITYEELKTDTRTQVLRIADFLGENHKTSLREDPGLLERVVDACSLESMKVFFKIKPEERMKKTAALALEKSMPFEAPKHMPKEKVEMHEGSGFVRKGIVGDWKNYFTSDQITEMKAWIAKKTKGSDVMTLWKDCDLP